MMPLILMLVIALTVIALFKLPAAWKSIVILVGFIYLAMIAANLYTAYWFFNKSYTMILDAGWSFSPYLLKIVSCVMALTIYSVAFLVFKACLRFQKWGTVTLMFIAYCGINLTLWAITAIVPDQISNPYFGGYNYKFYRDTEKNCVQRFPKEYEFNPDHIGVKLEVPDDTIVQEWRKNPCKDAGSSEIDEQKGKDANAQNQKAPSPQSNAQTQAAAKEAAAASITTEPWKIIAGWPAIDISYENNRFSYRYSIDAIGRTNSVTDIWINTQCLPGYSCEIPDFATDDVRCEPSYLTDQDGKVYKITYDQLAENESFNIWNMFGGHPITYRSLLDGEVVNRFLQFEPVPYKDGQQLTLHTPCAGGPGGNITIVYFKPSGIVGSK
jgi:hypothetical protein